MSLGRSRAETRSASRGRGSGRTGVVPTPVGPAGRDPQDPDLWEEWYQDDEDDVGPARFGWPVRLIALFVVVAVALLLLA